MFDAFYITYAAIACVVAVVVAVNCVLDRRAARARGPKRPGGASD